MMFGLFVSVLVPAMRMAGRESTRAELQQQAASAVRAVVSDLRRSAVGGVSLLQAPTGAQGAGAVSGVAMVRLASVTTNQRQVWEQVLRFYYRNPKDRRLYFRTYPPEPPDGLVLGLSLDRPVTVSPDVLKILSKHQAATTRVVAHDVEVFQVIPVGGGPVVSSPLEVVIEVARQSGPQQEKDRDERERVRARRVVDLRNRL